MCLPLGEVRRVKRINSWTLGAIGLVVLLLVSVRADAISSIGGQQVVTSGTDINTSDQVTVTHLAAALPLAQGGTNQTTGATSMWSGITASIAAATTDFISFGEDPNIALITS